jgi:hypothetical protein
MFQVTQTAADVFRRFETSMHRHATRDVWVAMQATQTACIRPLLAAIESIGVVRTVEGFVLFHRVGTFIQRLSEAPASTQERALSALPRLAKAIKHPPKPPAPRKPPTPPRPSALALQRGEAACAMLEATAPRLQRQPRPRT